MSVPGAAVASFVLHPQLAADCFVLGQRGPIHVLLHRTAQFPWLLLVPETPETELHRLPAVLRQALHALADQLGQRLIDEFMCQKLNVAAIGNVVPQLHLHVVGRRCDDPLWPRVVWGNLVPGQERSSNEAERLASRWRQQDLID